MRQKVEIEVDPAPAGYRYTGEYRRVALGEHYAYEGESRKCCGEIGCYLVLEKVEPKRESRWRRVPDVLETGPCGMFHTRVGAGSRRGYRVERIDYEDGKLVAVTLEPEGEEA